MTKLLLWSILFVLCWPVALLALVVYPLLWLIGLPLRALGSTVRAGVELVLALALFPILLPARLLRRV